MNCYLSKTDSVVDAISTRSCYTKKSERALDFFARFRALLSWCVCHHRRYSFRRPQNSAPYNRLICQTVQNEPFPWDAVMHIACICDRLARLQIQFELSDFAFLSTAKSGKSRIKNPFLDQPRPQGAFPWLWWWGGVTAFWASPRFGHPHSHIPSVLGIRGGGCPKRWSLRLCLNYFRLGKSRDC